MSNQRNCQIESRLLHRSRTQTSVNAVRGNLRPKVLLTHGGIDPLDLTLSTFCEPGASQAGIRSPSFQAFPHWAALHGLPAVSLPQEDWLLLCSPNNPRGNMIGWNSLPTLLSAYPGMVSLDEAYADFSAGPPSASLVDEFGNVVVLRTLSKSFGLAGLGVDALARRPFAIRAALRVQVPFCVPSLVRAAPLEALQ